MAAPSTLAVGVDKDEYSRLESERNTINVTVQPGIPHTEVGVASLIGAVSLTVTNASVFPIVGFPYSVTVGVGASLETVSVTSILGNVLNLAAPTLNAHAVCEPVTLVVPLSGEVVTVQLMKARRNRDVVVATQQLTLASSASATVAFFLPEIVDQLNAPRTRRGQYFIRATSVTNPAVFAESANFYVSILSVARFKQEFLHGLDEQALDSEAVRTQPQLITGATVTLVSKGHPKGWIPLSFNISDPGGCGTPVRLISWGGGQSVPLRAGQSKYTLRMANCGTAYVEVTVLDINALPGQSVAEELLIDRASLQDTFFRDQIDRAINWVEESALNVFIEPTRVVTELDPNQVAYAPGSDIPTFVQADWDKIVDAVTYVRPSAGHWINFRMPYYPVIEFNTLYGKVSNVRIVDIALEWIETHERGGFVELVPFNQETAFNFIGLIWVESVRGTIPIPNFWNFDALCGFRETPPVLVELIGKKAAIDALALIGQAFRPGVASQSVSRDGVSESVSYLSSGMYGIFSATIKTYKEWMDQTIPTLRGAYTGLNMQVI